MGTAFDQMVKKIANAQMARGKIITTPGQSVLPTEGAVSAHDLAMAAMRSNTQGYAGAAPSSGGDGFDESFVDNILKFKKEEGITRIG